MLDSLPSGLDLPMVVRRVVEQIYNRIDGLEMLVMNNFVSCC
jgi:hypothetical protein